MSRITHLILGVLLTSRLAAAPEDVSADLAKFTQDGKVPGLVAAAVLDGKIIAVGATGVRKYGDKTPVSVGDKFHIGSCTKSMTGSLAAMLVADGKIKWSSTVEEIFPKMRIHPDFKSATLLQLCSNTGGTPHDVPPELWQKTGEDRDKSESSQRANFIRAILADAPAYPPGSQNVYSNSGFTIAGAMLEKVSGMSYEELIRTRLFKPLKMDSAGFGAPATPGKTDQPYGHVLQDGNPFPIPAGSGADNPPAITPAGRVHLSITDFAKYANLHLGTAEKSPLNAESLKFLHTIVPPSKDYALGWSSVERSWAGGTALNHNGTNTMNFAVIWLAPDKKFGAVAACNIDSGLGAKACDDAVSFLIGKFLTSGN